MQLIDDDGRLLDARYVVEPDGPHLAVIVDSRRGSPSRNPDYNQVLTVLLSRLGQLNAVLADAVVDSRHTQGLSLPESDRRLIDAPIPLALEADVDALRRRLGIAQAKVGRAPDAMKGGNSNKRIRLRLDVPGYGHNDTTQLAATLAAPVNEAAITTSLKDDDPLWEQHSGGDGHRGQEWGPGDGRRAAEFYRSLSQNARLILDLLMDHPGQQVNSERLAAQMRGLALGRTGEPTRHVVAASLRLTGTLAAASGRRLPFYWWRGRDSSASLYAMKPIVAALFREARQQSGPSTADAEAGTDWTAAEVAAAVDDYLEMLTAEAADKPYSKTEHRRALKRRLNAHRTDSAIEYKYQNISAAMIALGLPYIRGYKPMGNLQEALSTEIQRRLQADPALLGRLKGKLAAAVPASHLQRTDPPQRAAGSKERASAGSRPGRHPDYGLLQDENTKRGATGEQLVVDYERTWLREHGRSDLAERVRWTARDDGDGLGYDVLSYNLDGHERYIEVKTTALGALTPFYLSSAELDFARRHLRSYTLYRVFAVLSRPPRFFALQGNDILELELTSVTYRACLPARPKYGQETTDDQEYGTDGSKSV